MPERTEELSINKDASAVLQLTGELQPSYQLIDKCNTMLESGALVPPAVCKQA